MITGYSKLIKFMLTFLSGSGLLLHRDSSCFIDAVICSFVFVINIFYC